MDSTREQAWQSVVDALVSDADDDVTVTDAGLAVRGRLFAFIQQDELLVALAPARSADLVARGIARAATGAASATDTDTPTADWVAVTEIEDWIELATEAHQFVGEPRVGGES